jgi:hypothetical protein
MDEQRLQHACELLDEGKYTEAYHEFIQLAENTPDPLERAWPLIYAANTRGCYRTIERRSHPDRGTASLKVRE